MVTTPYAAAADDLDGIRSVAETHGFCLVKGVFSPAELAALLSDMRAATQAFGGGVMPDLLSLPQLRDVYFHPRVLTIARKLLGDALVYDGEGTLNFEETIGSYTLNPYTGLHCDARGMPNDLDAIWRSANSTVFRGYRFGIYFQDYRAASGSLKVIVGSHHGDPDDYAGERLSAGTETTVIVGTRALTYRPTRFPLFNLPSEPGDLVVWNLRTFHAAGAKLFVHAPTLAVHPAVEASIAKATSEAFAPPPGPRNALFFDYAAPCEEIDLYIKNRARPSERNLSSLCARAYDDDALVARAKSHGVELRLDSIIIAQSIAAYGAQRSGSVDRSALAHRRIYKAMQQHREYSPYFPLLAPETYRDAAAISPEALVDAVIAGVAAATIESA